MFGHGFLLSILLFALSSFMVNLFIGFCYERLEKARARYQEQIIKDEIGRGIKMLERELLKSSYR